MDVPLAIFSELTHKKGVGGVMRYFAANGKYTIHLIPILSASGNILYI